MAELKKCFGIISLLPDNSQIRERRKTCIIKLLNQLNELWPDVDILISANNWGEDYELWVPEIKNNLTVVDTDVIGICANRIKLREEFLKRDYDYIILMDDDCAINCDSPELAADYMKAIDEHPNGFAIIKGTEDWKTEYDYAQAPLNLCAISKSIFTETPFPNLSVENCEAMEDRVYAFLLHNKYPKAEFYFPDGIYHTHYVKRQYIKQFTRPDEVPPSVWAGLVLSGNGPHKTYHNTTVIRRYMEEHHDIDMDAIKELDTWMS
jgi:hypothetical protein